MTLYIICSYENLKKKKQNYLISYQNNSKNLKLQFSSI